MTVHKQSVSVKIYRQSGIADASRKLAAMGLHQRLGHVQDGQTVTLLCIAQAAAGNGGQMPIYGILTYAGTLPSVGTVLAGSTWQVVDCPSLAGTSNTATTGTGGAG